MKIAFPRSVIRFCSVTTCLLAASYWATAQGDSGVQEMTAPLVSKDSLPTVDGTVNEEEWRRALALHVGMSVQRARGEQNRQFSVYLIADEEALYVGAVSPKWSDELRTGDWERDDLTAALEDDRYELIVKPPVTPPIPRYHLKVNAAGNIYDHQQDPHRSDVFKQYYHEDWNGEWEFKQSVTDTAWHIEYRLPVSMFSDKRKAAEGLWEVNIGRAWRRRGFSGLTPEAISLARLHVVPNAPGVELRQLGELAAGKLDVVFTAEDPALGEKADGKKGAAMQATCVIRPQNGHEQILRENGLVPVTAPGANQQGGIKASFQPAEKNDLLIILWDPERDLNFYYSKIPFSKAK